MLSPQARCRTLDEAANGYARGEGCGAIVLLPVAEAMRAGRPILAVLRGSSMNQDGKTATLTGACTSQTVELEKAVLCIIK